MNGPSHHEDLLVGFREEALDLLHELPGQLAKFEADSSDAEAINVIFRSVHTIKGNAGFFGLSAIKTFAHSLEDAFDEIRQGRLILTEELGRALLAGLDVLNEMVEQVGDGETDEALGDDQEELLARIKELCGASLADDPESRLLAEVLKLSEEIAAAGAPQSADWSARLKALAGASEQDQADGDVEDAEEPSPAALTEATLVCCEEDVAPLARPLLDLFLNVDAGDYAETVGEHFLSGCEAFAAWADEHDQGELARSLRAARADFDTIFSSPLDIDPFLISVVWDRLGPELGAMRQAPPPEPAAASETANKTSTTPKTEQPAAEQAAAPPPAKTPEATDAAKDRFLRVKEERVDTFLDDVSSLFTTCERLKDLQTRMAACVEARDLVEEMRQINTTLAGQSTALQKSVVELRKVPARGLFSKFPRVARTLASKLGKQLDVQVAGEGIEIDKSLVDDLDGPLMHMVRNVCDHGIEPPEERVARGVSPSGSLSMDCRLTKSHVVITVQDDGRGIDPARLRDKAVQKGVLTTEQAGALSDQEAVELIFHPGFSTAEQISEVSGRGVGLDVVRTRLRELNGDVQVASTLGVGTTFRLSIPIRKAVVVEDGLLVRHGSSTFVVPFDNIGEIVRLERSELHYVHGKPVAIVRGEPYAAVELHEILDLPAGEFGDATTVDGVVLRGKTQSICLLVGAVLGQRKVVVASLADGLASCDKVNGVAQLGSGRLALVLNGQELIEAASQAVETTVKLDA